MYFVCMCCFALGNLMKKKQSYTEKYISGSALEWGAGVDGCCCHDLYVVEAIDLKGDHKLTGWEP